MTLKLPVGLSLLAIRVQAILDDIAPSDPRAKKFKPQELYDQRYLDELEKSGFFDKLWAGVTTR